MSLRPLMSWLSTGRVEPICSFRTEYSGCFKAILGSSSSTLLPVWRSGCMCDTLLGEIHGRTTVVTLILGRVVLRDCLPECVWS